LHVQIGQQAHNRFKQEAKKRKWQVEQIESDVLHHLRDYAVPFLDRFGSLFDVINYLE